MGWPATGELGIEHRPKFRVFQDARLEGLHQPIDEGLVDANLAHLGFGALAYPGNMRGSSL
jgi:hypothetical protein